MPTDSSEPLDGFSLDSKSVSLGEFDCAEIHTALSSSEPLDRQRGIAACETLLEASVDAVRPLLDAIASAVTDDNAPIALRAISVLDAVAESDPAALEGHTADLVGAVDSEIADVQLTGATVLGKLAVSRPALVAPHSPAVIDAIRATELDTEPQDFGDVIADEVTRRTLRNHEEAERKRRIAGRHTLVNVAVAIAEAEPESMVDTVPDLATLLDDEDPTVAGGAVDALAELAAANPTAVAPATDRLVDCLDRDSAVVRARTVRALGHLGDAATVSHLRTAAADDPDADVRELAAETAKYIADAP
ncbi:HEAT repeat domain-containing protein [Natrialba asiatica]|uniref:Adaptin N terminal region protein n=1 Tax=Natrialba asiatica (strain ATCC 700177 / DSM 12278 / JCM 9576 / FERM P-10747 / NBRC 102637 / 172P1) TaxID=29540 RepID=M0B5J0_NATA1|nr:HEAT repeat domain-containing protein [Natrialba asiatica]ELZ06060.1 Adaptin N terminal region protein [Natrialba asiatica DSM 12278]